MGAAGAESASGDGGFWVYLVNKVRPATYFAMYQGGPAVARIRLYEIDPARHAPAIRLPEGLPQRLLMLDWERQAEQDPRHLVDYCRLMGYNAVSPIMLKWCTAMWGDPLAGYAPYNVDARGYWLHQEVTKAGAEVPAVRGQPTMHDRYLQATRGSGVHYLPRIEYGGSEALPKEARAIGSDAAPAKPNRFGTWSANLLHPATWDDAARVMETLVKPYVADNPQLAGVLLRSRCDRMQISFGRSDVEMYCHENSVPMPGGDARMIAAWAASGDGAAGYKAWWLRKRAQFHIRLRDLLCSYRPDLLLLYNNWDSDKWALGIYDQNTSNYFRDLVAAGPGRALQVYERNTSLLKSISGEDMARMIRTGDLRIDQVLGRADLAMDMNLYRDAGQLQILAPASDRHMADSPAYLAWFRSNAGLAVSNMVSYDEGGYKRVNPKYECNMMTPGGPAYSMALEVLAWFHGDARTLTWTAYTYGRGFAQAHRRFAQAFLALPAVPGTVLSQADPELRLRQYPTAAGVYVGAANTGFSAKTVTATVPGRWTKPPVVTDLVSGAVLPSRITADAATFDLQVGAMELNAYLIR
jgi:hypothetical protein